ncbi:MAG: ribose 5-phosphate isomerase B [Bryobacteraceae bacterium]
MKIAIGADHAGFALKEKLRDRLVAEGFEVHDVGTNNSESSDYPDFASRVGHEVASGSAERGVLVCSSGVGMSIAANKIPGIRAALATHEEEVRLTRSHNDANVLTIGAKYTSEEEAGELLNVFLSTGFEGGRHARRVDKITKLEEEANHR